MQFPCQRELKKTGGETERSRGYVGQTAQTSVAVAQNALTRAYPTRALRLAGVTVSLRAGFRSAVAVAVSRRT